MTFPLTDMLAGVAPLAEHYEFFLLDVWGVLHDGLKPYPGVVDCLTRLKKAGRTTLLLSNTPRRNDHLAAQLADIGIPRDLYTYVLTAGEAAHEALSARRDDFHKFCGRRVLFIGEPSMRPLMDGLDLEESFVPADTHFILNARGGMDTVHNSEIEGLLDQCLPHRLPMVCANPDIIVRIGDNLLPCAGTFAKYYEDKGGPVFWHGKPHKAFYERGWDILGRPPKHKICAIGDSLRTDIQGAVRFGVDGIFNLAGIHWDEVQLDHEPGRADMMKVQAIVAAQSYHPSAILHDFRW